MGLGEIITREGGGRRPTHAALCLGVYEQERVCMENNNISAALCPLPLTQTPRAYPRQCAVANSEVTSGRCRELREPLIRAKLHALAMYAPVSRSSIRSLGDGFFFQASQAGEQNTARQRKKSSPNEGVAGGGCGGRGRALFAAHRRGEQRVVGDPTANQLRIANRFLEAVSDQALKAPGGPCD